MPALGTIIIIALLASSCNHRSPQSVGIAEVGVITVKPERVVLTTELPGRTAAYRVAEIRPQVNGLILKRQFED